MNFLLYWYSFYYLHNPSFLCLAQPYFSCLKMLSTSEILKFVRAQNFLITYIEILTSIYISGITRSIHLLKFSSLMHKVGQNLWNLGGITDNAGWFFPLKNDFFSLELQMVTLESAMLPTIPHSPLHTHKWFFWRTIICFVLFCFILCE